jgi:TetR/AcrR family transcriptional regulator, transcriptional repressor for nem operon
MTASTSETTASPPVTPTKSALIDATVDLLQEVGWAKLSMRELATRVGIRAPSIHHHYPTKADLGLAVIQRMREERSERSAALVANHGDIRQRLLALGDLVAECIVDDQRSCPIYAFQAEYSILTPALQAAISAWIDDVILDLTSWMEEGRATGQLTFAGEARNQALIMWSVLQQGTQLHRTLPTTNFTTLVRHLVASISV